MQAEGWIIFILSSVHQKEMNRKREGESAVEKDEDAEMRGKGWKVFLAGRPSFSHAPVNVLTGSVCATEEQVSYTQTKMDVVLLNTEHTSSIRYINIKKTVREFAEVVHRKFTIIHRYWHHQKSSDLSGQLDVRGYPLALEH